MKTSIIMKGLYIIMESLYLLRDYLHTILFPKQKCLLCDKTLSGNNNINLLYDKHHESENKVLHRQLKMPYICNTCKDQLKILSKPFCKYCHKPLVKNYSSKTIIKVCKDCKGKSQSELIYNRSATLYNDFMKDKIALYKYRGKESLSTAFSYLLKISYDEYFAKLNIDLITYVPLHPIRLEERGFNQAEQIASQLSQLTGKPVLNVLERVKETAKQSKRSKRERLKQIEGSFIAIDKAIPEIKNKKILLIDDIYTTGSTITECTKALKATGIKEVLSLTLARAF